MSLTVWQIVAAICGAMGIPTTITGLLVWRFQKKIEKRDKEREERERKQEEAREQLQLLNTKGTLAALKLAEATARAVERIPDTHCNGDMHEALEYATGVKNQIRDFLRDQGVKAVIQ